MSYCSICNKKITVFNSGIYSKLKDGRICIKCINMVDINPPQLKEYLAEDIKKIIVENEVKIAERHKQKDEKMKTIALENEMKIAEQHKQFSVFEYKRTCCNCGKIWYVLASQEIYLSQEQKQNRRSQLASIFGVLASLGSPNNYSFNTLIQTKRNEHDLIHQTLKLRQCPNCNSSSYNEEAIYQTEHDNQLVSQNKRK